MTFASSWALANEPKEQPEAENLLTCRFISAVSSVASACLVWLVHWLALWGEKKPCEVTRRINSEK